MRAKKLNQDFNSQSFERVCRFEGLLTLPPKRLDWIRLFDLFANREKIRFAAYFAFLKSICQNRLPGAEYSAASKFRKAFNCFTSREKPHES